MTAKCISGSLYTMILTQSNELYSIGELFTLNHDESVSSSPTHRKNIHKINLDLHSQDSIDSISCGYAHTLIISQMGRIFHLGTMPIYSDSNSSSNIQFNKIPFEVVIKFSSSVAHHSIQGFAKGKFGFVLISNILSTESQLLHRLTLNGFWKQLQSEKLLTDIEIITLLIA